MLLNSFGFASAPLYLFSEFFESRPVEHLLGPGVEARHLNDDRLGRVLEQLYEYGTSTFFLQVAQQAVERFGVRNHQLHLDSSSFSGLVYSYSDVLQTGSIPKPQRVDALALLMALTLMVYTLAERKLRHTLAE